MAKKVKEEPVIEQEQKEKQTSVCEIEIIKECAGMAIGTKRVVPASLAKQMIEKGNAKQL